MDPSGFGGNATIVYNSLSGRDFFETGQRISS
jgi:hypothetical protein